MNITRGLVRAWIVLTALYLLRTLFASSPQPSDWWSLVCVYLGPPIAFAVGLALLGWILDGFRQER